LNQNQNINDSVKGYFYSNCRGLINSVAAEISLRTLDAHRDLRHKENFNSELAELVCRMR